MYSRNFYSWFPWRQRAVLQSRRRSCPYLTMTRKNLRSDPYGYARIREKNFSINIFSTCNVRRAYTFRCAGTPTWNELSWNVLVARIVIDYTNILLIKILSDLSMYFEICQGLQWHSSLDEWYCALACDRFGLPRHVEEDELSTHSRAKVKFTVRINKKRWNLPRSGH